MGVGFPKSGTCTLHRAFLEAGLRSAHQKHRFHWVAQILYGPADGLRAFDVLLQPDVCNPGRRLNRWPQLDYELLARLRARGVTLLLHTRDTAALISSISRWRGLRDRLVRSEIPGLPAGTGGRDVELEQWIEGHYRACQELGAVEVAIEAADTPARLEALIRRPLPWWGVENANPAR